MGFAIIKKIKTFITNNITTRFLSNTLTIGTWLLVEINRTIKFFEITSTETSIILESSVYTMISTKIP